MLFPSHALLFVAISAFAALQSSSAAPQGGPSACQHACLTAKDSACPDMQRWTVKHFELCEDSNAAAPCYSPATCKARCQEYYSLTPDPWMARRFCR